MEEIVNSLSSAKRVRQNKTRRLRNRMIKSEVRTSIKAFEKAVEEKNTKLAESQLTASISLLDKAVSKGVYKKNTASRKKSRMSKSFNQINKAA